MTAGAVGLALSQNESLNTSVYRDSQQAPVPGATNHWGHRCCKDPRNPRPLTLLGLAPDKSALVVPLSCRSRRCPCCRWALRSRDRARAIRGARADGWDTFFVTLTLPAPDRPADRYLVAREAGGRQLSGEDARLQLMLRHASASWNRLRTAMLREPEFRDGIEYFRAVELTQRGVPHLHLIVRRPHGALGSSPWFMAFAKWRRLIQAAGFGVVTDVQRVSRGGTDRVAEYVTKATAGYVTKGQTEQLPRWTRYASWSKGYNPDWQRPTPLAGFAWQLGRAGVAFTSDALTASGFTVKDPADYRVPRASGAAGAPGEITQWQ